MPLRKVEQVDRQPEASKMELMDNEIGQRMTNKFMGMDGFDKVYQQLHAGDKDPAGAAGMLAAQVVLNTREAAIKNGIKLSDRIWAADGGVLDNVVNRIGQSIPYLDPDELKQHALKVMQMYDDAGKQKEQSQPNNQAPAPTKPSNGGLLGTGEGGLW